MSDQKFDKLRVLVLSLGHMVNDSYSNVVPALLPLLIKTYNWSYALSGSIMTVFTFTSSIIQPIFGYYSDRHGRRWMVALSVLWIAFFMSMIGIIGYLGLDSTGTYVVILAMVGLAGFGSSAYHPQASSMVPRISGDRKGLGVSIFSAGGNLGYAVMPLMVVPVTKIWGIPGVLLLFIPGAIMSFVLQRYAPEAPSTAVQPKISEILADIKSVAKPLSIVTAIVCMRAWLFFGIITFLVTYMVDVQGQSHELSSVFLSVLLFFGAVGTLIGGHSSDAYGRKFVIAVSLLLTGPLLFLGLSTTGVLELVLFALAGLTLLMSFSPAVLIAQSLIPKNQGVASGIVLGFAIGIGGLGVSITGFLMDTFGPKVGIYSLVLLPIIGLLLTLLLPGKIMPERMKAKNA